MIIEITLEEAERIETALSAYVDSKRRYAARTTNEGCAALYEAQAQRASEIRRKISESIIHADFAPYDAR